MNDWMMSLSQRAFADTVFLIGLMSGTSADAADAVLVELSGSGRETRVRERAFVERPYPDEVRSRLFRLFRGEGTVADVGAANVEVAETFADAVFETCARAGMDPTDVLAIGSHGQTIWHDPPSTGTRVPGTLQIGNPALLAERTGIPVVSDFRSADIARGGEGAPLVPYVDWLLFTDEKASRLLLNIGGIANLTYLPRHAEPHDVIAFDTGPGNAPIDAAVTILTRGEQSADWDGALAGSGTPDLTLLAEWRTDPYFTRTPPKSTGRERFGTAFAERCIAEGRSRGLSDADLLATLTALTAYSIVEATVRFLDERIDEVVVSGGGAKNPTLMRMLREAFASFGQQPTFRAPEEWGIRVESKEAVAFAVLARETLRGIPTNLPSVTGARERAILGSVTPGSRRA